MIPAGEALSAEVIASAVSEYGLGPLGPGAAEKFALYYEILVRWNAKLSLTAIRRPEDILSRHFLECIFCAESLPAGVATLLDYGSGGGFPGIPIAICRPEIGITLAESQGKKASFLREAVRVLGLKADVYSGRVESMAEGLRFTAVTLRAVDRMAEAIAVAAERVAADGWLVVLTTAGELRLPPEFVPSETSVPGLTTGTLVIASREEVPRGTAP